MHEQISLNHQLMHLNMFCLSPHQRLHLLCHPSRLIRLQIPILLNRILLQASFLHYQLHLFHPYHYDSLIFYHLIFFLLFPSFEHLYTLYPENPSYFPPVYNQINLMLLFLHLPNSYYHFLTHFWFLQPSYVETP